MQRRSVVDELIWIACIPKVPGVPKPQAAVAIERCRKCQHKIWLAPSTIEILLCRADLARAICIPCWVNHMKESPQDWKDFTLHMTDRQRAEVAKGLGITPDAIDAALAQWGITSEMLDLKGRS